MSKNSGRKKDSTLDKINCPICKGTGVRFDGKTSAVRDCTGCRGTGLVKNPNYNPDVLR